MNTAATDAGPSSNRRRPKKDRIVINLKANASNPAAAAAARETDMEEEEAAFLTFTPTTDGARSAAPPLLAADPLENARLVAAANFGCGPAAGRVADAGVHVASPAVTKLQPLDTPTSVLLRHSPPGAEGEHMNLCPLPHFNPGEKLP